MDGGTQHLPEIYKVWENYLDIPSSLRLQWGHMRSEQSPHLSAAFPSPLVRVTVRRWKGK